MNDLVYGPASKFYANVPPPATLSIGGHRTPNRLATDGGGQILGSSDHRAITPSVTGGQASEQVGRDGDRIGDAKRLKDPNEDVEVCEWNPLRGVSASGHSPGDCPQSATWSVGTGARNLHLCDACAALAGFKRWSKRQLPRQQTEVTR